ncbi:hypothetical protein K431DRAFT_216391 [Polychaeton citri CBS 116435]|uniref:protein-tyrosine-phosphatase n=1 Tax=Polychaeton citri CBS 116435 TaxID=1314669 RepID=A0A9P4QFT8_9PEZI|nr:hypothetical protein K431DRAFT_216391 [Polychaeton citri CBS 116435]
MPPLFSPRLPAPQQQTPAPKTPSPNYFGFQSGDSSFLTEAGGNQTRQNWSPPSSAVRSTAAISPTVIPLDQNPDFEAFRRQSEGKAAFALAGFGGGNLKTPSISLRHPDGRRTSKASPPWEDARPSSEPRGVPTRSLHGKADSLDPATSELSQSPKRLLSPGSLHLPEASRRGSPAGFASAEHGNKTSRTETSSDTAPRFHLPLDSVSRSMGLAKHRAETLPASGAAEDSLLTTAQHVVTLMQSSPELLLLLDLRVQTQYATSHISGSLSLCIPTTLLKRPSFNVQKLAETFKDSETKARFENWRKSKYIIVYDNSSAQLKDAQTCINTIKKFNAEGYEGTTYIIKGGFVDFSRTFPQYVERGDTSESENPSRQGVAWDGPKVAPVVGGCPMPGTDQPANPFFGNIRQNMDLIGGVGQIALQHPAKATAQLEHSQFPRWLKQASEGKDQGKMVSNKFEAIERREKKRMEDALSTTVSYGGSPKEPESQKSVVQIAGLEKGNKNRYNNIWPFEHSRVKLQGIPTSGCDYFNANHIKASWSNKRYISTQAPIPATFNDFWSVIWQQDVRVIVMLTAEKEGAQVKAHNYWDMKQYGPLRLEFLSEKKASLEPDRIQRHKQRPAPGKRSSTSTIQIPLAQIESKDINKANGTDQPYVTVRRFTLSHEGFPFQRMREITQLQYSSWPDFGAPAHPAHLLGLVEQTDAVVRVTENPRVEEPEHSNPRPILVHCSAGCGRTGTFCTVDSVIDMLKRQHNSRQQLHHQTTAMDIDDDGGFFASQFQDLKEGLEGSWVVRDDLDLIEKTVEDFRHQRLSMVQSLRQFVLCYESIMEWLVHHQEVNVL